MKWTQEDDDLLKIVGINNRVPTLLRQYFKNKSIDSIRNRIKKFDIKYKNVNADFFSQDDEISNYILGYWLADGCLCKKQGGYYFIISSIDYDHLLKIRDNMSILTFPAITGSIGNCYNLSVGNRELFTNLLKLGGATRKTETIKISDLKYNPIYFYDFLRGYFDGDGCIMRQKSKSKKKYYFSGAGFVGCFPIMESLKEILDNLSYKSRLYKDKRESNCWKIELYGQSAKLLLHNMYRTNSKIFLDRKYKLYLDLVSPLQ